MFVFCLVMALLPSQYFLDFQMEPPLPGLNQYHGGLRVLLKTLHRGGR